MFQSVVVVEEGRLNAPAPGAVFAGRLRGPTWLCVGSATGLHTSAMHPPSSVHVCVSAFVGVCVCRVCAYVRVGWGAVCAAANQHVYGHGGLNDSACTLRRTTPRHRATHKSDAQRDASRRPEHHSAALVASAVRFTCTAFAWAKGTWRLPYRQAGGLANRVPSSGFNTKQWVNLAIKDGLAGLKHGARFPGTTQSKTR